MLVQLPTYNESGVVSRALEAACAIDWPRDRLHIQLLDDSTDETTEIAAAKIEALRQRGHDVTLVHRSNREGFKAGALKAGLELDHSPYVAIFDADFVPPPDILRRTIPALLRDSRLAFVQTRWEHMNREHSILTRAQALMLDAHFVVEQAARAWSGMFMPFNGTGGVWRRAAIEDAGGWEGDTLTEDIDLAIRGAMRGWRSTVFTSVAVPGELPEGVSAWRTQQFRWTKGFAQVAFKLLPSVWASGLTTTQKAALTVQLFQGWAYPVSAVALFAVLTAMILSSTQPWLVLFIGVFSTVYGALGVSAMVILGQIALKRPMDHNAAIGFGAMLALNGGLTLSNSRSIWEAVINKQSAFVRTPKGKDGRIDKARPIRSQEGLAELGIAVCAIAVAIWDEAWYSPFFFLTVFGLALVGSASLVAQATRAPG